jgi:glycine/D-amino acid oxidase-like deaminating enzyme
LMEGCKVERIIARSGRITGLATSEGELAADAIVLAAGLWSRRLLLPLGIALAQWPCEHFYVIAETHPRLSRDTPSFVVPEDLLYGREEVGAMMLGAFDEKARTIEEENLPEPFAFTLLDPLWDKFAPYFETATEIFPFLAEAPIRRFVNGPESFTPDGVPLIGAIDSIEGLYVATGMNSGGVTQSAAAGCRIADLLAGVPPRFDLTSVAPGRFGPRAADANWLRAAASDAVSHGYRHSNLAQAEAPAGSI